MEKIICITWALTKHGISGLELKNHYLFARLSHIITYIVSISKTGVLYNPNNFQLQDMSNFIITILQPSWQKL